MTHSSQQPLQWTCCLLWLLAEKLGKVQCWCFVCNVSLNVFYKFTGGCGNPPRPSQQPAYFLSHLLPTNIGKLGSLLLQHRQCSSSGGGAQDVPKISSFHPLVIAPSVTMQCTTFQQGPGPAVIQMSAWNKSMVLNISPPPAAVYRVCTKYRHLRVILQTSERWLARDSDGDNVSEALIMNQITSIRMR